MMDKQQQEQQRAMKVRDAQWPPRSATYTPGPSLFYRVSEEHGMKKIAWPPRASSVTRTVDLNGHDGDYNGSDHMAPTHDSAHNNQERLSAGRPSGCTPPPPPGIVTHPLRQKPPVKQSPVATVPSQPFLRSSTPTRKTGDLVWPPKKSNQDEDAILSSRKFAPQEGKPKRSPPKDYRPLFSRHRIPSSCPVTYWVPPGTQHIDPQ